MEVGLACMHMPCWLPPFNLALDGNVYRAAGSASFILKLTRGANHVYL